MTVREMFELIEDLCNEYGIDEVEKTMNSIFQSLRDWQNEKESVK